MTLGSLFDGMGGWCLAAVHNGVTPLWGSEIDKNPASVAHRHFPDVKQLGDITKINADDLEPVDIVCAGSPCLTADSLILTIDGYKPITDIQVGELVLTKSNVWHKVANKFDNGEHETCYISGVGFENIHCTTNHKFWARVGRRKGHSGKRVFSEPEFVEAKELTKHHYIGLPIIDKEEKFYTDDKDFWWMIGYYLGDGWLAKNCNDIHLACNDEKLTKLKSHLPQDKYKYTVQDNGTCYRLRFANQEIYRFIKQNIGTGCCKKHIPVNIVHLPKEQLMELYQGYLASDGCIVNGKHQFSSVNRRMAYELLLVINKLFHKWACIYKIKTPDTTIIEGREVNQKDWYQVKFNPSFGKQDHCFVEDGYLWLAFGKRTMAGIESVYNMEVEEDHSYIVQGVISKNCQDLSVAGRRAGLEGERSGLFRTAIDIVRRLRARTRKPRYFVWENVLGAFSSQKGMDFKAVLEEICEAEIPMPQGGKWAESGVVECGGTRVEWLVLDASRLGVPQRRKRIFLVADFANPTGSESPILFEPSCLCGDTEESRSQAKDTTNEVRDGLETTGRSLLGEHEDNPLTKEDGRFL